MLRVLLVDDEPLIQRVVERMLPEHRVVPCLGPGALELCRRVRPDVAIVDRNLFGGIDGLALAHRFREIFPEMRIVMTSGADLDDESLSFPVLLKPFGRQELLEAIYGDNDENPNEENRP